MSLNMTRQPASARIVELDRNLPRRSVAGGDHGRVVFTQLPAIRPVNHLVVDGRVIQRPPDGQGVRLAMKRRCRCRGRLQADDLDPRRRTGGWW